MTAARTTTYGKIPMNANIVRDVQLHTDTEVAFEALIARMIPGKNTCTETQRAANTSATPSAYSPAALANNALAPSAPHRDNR